MTVGWQMRYFVLQGPYLVYFETEADFNLGHTSKGTISLNDIDTIDYSTRTALKEVVDSTCSSAERFEITIRMVIGSGGRLYELRAMSHVEALSWLAYINDARTEHIEILRRKKEIESKTKSGYLFKKCN
jgi:hypothetical protein